MTASMMLHRIMRLRCGANREKFLLQQHSRQARMLVKLLESMHMIKQTVRQMRSFPMILRMDFQIRVQMNMMQKLERMQK